MVDKQRGGKEKELVGLPQNTSKCSPFGINITSFSTKPVFNIWLPVELPDKYWFL